MNQIDLFINGLLKYAEENKHIPRKKKEYNKVIFMSKNYNLICSTVKHTQIENTLYKGYEVEKVFLLKYCRIYSLFFLKYY